MNDFNTDIKCKGCGKALTENQINRMKNQKDATTWVKDGYHSFVCYKQHNVITGAEYQSKSTDDRLPDIKANPRSARPKVEESLEKSGIELNEKNRTWPIIAGVLLLIVGPMALFAGGYVLTIIAWVGATQAFRRRHWKVAL